MEHQIYRIIDFMAAAFLHIWPYLLITIPVAVIVRLFDGTKYISRIFTRRPIIGILVATLVGAISPFCSCGVIPVVASLLIGGVPLAPVMSFWIASPSMDPEMFFLSVSTLGWELAVWRLAATLCLSLGAGLVTHYMVKRGLLGEYLRISADAGVTTSVRGFIKRVWSAFFKPLGSSSSPIPLAAAGADHPNLCCTAIESESAKGNRFKLNSPASSTGRQLLPLAADSYAPASECSPACACPSPAALPLWRKLTKETIAATTLVAKFMALAFLIEALIELYIPSEWISGLLGKSNSLAILWAALIGVPAYTSNLTALPMVSGLLSQGMNPGAALAFLIAGPTTTLPAMAAVWGLVSRRVFFLYVSIALIGSLLAGYLYAAVHAIL